jgi:hypothetical protein
MGCVAGQDEPSVGAAPRRGALEVVYSLKPRNPDGRIEIDKALPLIRKRISRIDDDLQPKLTGLGGNRVKIVIDTIDAASKERVLRALEDETGRLELRLVEFIVGSYDSPLGMRNKLLKAQKEGKTRVGPMRIDGVTYWWDYLPEVRYGMGGDDESEGFQDWAFADGQRFCRHLATRGKAAAAQDLACPERRIWQVLADVPDGRKTIEAFADDFDGDDTGSLAELMNQVLIRRDLYRRADFEDVERGDELNALLDKDAAALDFDALRRRHRLLLEASFPKFINISPEKTITARYWVRGSKAMITGNDFSHVELAWQNMRPVVAFGLRGEAARRMGDMTGDNIAKRLAIVLDDEIRQAPTIRARIANQGIIDGGFTRREAERTVQYIRQGPLPFTMTKESERFTGEP